MTYAIDGTKPQGERDVTLYEACRVIRNALLIRRGIKALHGLDFWGC